ncbi:MAG TPA: GNAT family N-acetyltransferase [Thermomicrobiales bacterium]|nr:GNAT family N-acetyltransferase [Thermomicrobiales bacterium]
MKQLTDRFYRDDNDLERMLTLVSASMGQDGFPAGHFHRGDIVWGLFQNLTIDPSSRIRLFEDGEGKLRGFVWLHPPRGFGIHVNSTFPDVESTITTMVRWAEAHLRATSAPDETVTAFEVMEVPSTDDRFKKTLAALGYRIVDGDVAFQLGLRDLRGDISEPTLPSGAEIRPVRVEDAAEVEARVALHQDVWKPSRFSVEGYARLRSKPVYRPDLDLVAVAPDGELASYCVVWWDPTTQTGEFEPVGTASRFRRQGYGRALLLDALRRLQALGGADALVISETGPERAPSRSLYASVGFEVIVRFESWERAEG